MEQLFETLDNSEDTVSNMKLAIYKGKKELNDELNL